MLMYKGFKAVYLGLKRWRIYAPSGWSFDIGAVSIFGLIQCIDRWRNTVWA